MRQHVMRGLAWCVPLVVLSAATPAAAHAAVKAPQMVSGVDRVWQPAPGTSWQWQIVGRVRAPYRDVSMYDIDLQDAVPTRTQVDVPGFGSVTWPRGVNSDAIQGLHQAGTMVVCYLDSGAWESYRPDADLFPRSVIGRSTGWPGERWLDIRSASWHKFAPIIWARLRLAREIGCDGVEPDENNPVGNHPGFPISHDQEKAWYLKVASAAHRVDLSVGMKNGIEIVDPELVRAFDWALDEECFYYHECRGFHPFIAAGKAVFQTEYVSDWRRRGLDSLEAVAGQVCPGAIEDRFSTLVKKHVPDASYVACRA